MNFNAYSVNNQKSQTLNNDVFLSNNNFLMIEKNINLINFPLTRILLKLYSFIFEIPNKFSIIVNEITCLDFIRLHYISFIKLYNKNLDLSTKLGDMTKYFENCQKNEIKKKIKKLIRDVYNDDSYLQIILQLCKLHIKCLFNLAKNRNQEVTKNFLQLGIVYFMTKEIDLEHEAAEKIYKYKTQKLKEGEMEKEKSRKNSNNNTLSSNKLKINNDFLKENNINKKLSGNLMQTNFKLNDNLNIGKVNEENLIELYNENNNLGNSKNKINNDEENMVKHKLSEKKDDKINDREKSLSDEFSNYLSSEYSDLSYDLIDREKVITSNINLNLNLNLNHIIKPQSIPINKSKVIEDEKINKTCQIINDIKKVSDINDLKIENEESYKNIKSEKSSSIFNTSYVDNEKIQLEDNYIQSEPSKRTQKNESNNLINKNINSNNSLNNNSIEDKECLDFDSYRSINSYNQLDIIENPGFQKSKIPIKLAKCNLYINLI